MINPSASAIERCIVCPDSHILDHAHDTNANAVRGTEIAKFVRNVISGMSRRHAGDLVENERWRATCLAIDFHKLVGDLSLVRGEMAYALDTKTNAVRELGSNIGRKYPPLSATEVGGTNDLEGVRIDSVQVVIDIKTGQDVTECERNPQILYHARVRQLLTGASEVEGRIAYISEHGQIRLDCHTFSMFDLDVFAFDLAAMVARIAEARARIAGGGRVIVTSGDHCTYCPAMTSCPKYTALARTMASDIAAIAARLEAMPPEEQGIAWEKGKDVERLLSHVFDGLKAIAKRKPIPLRNGNFIARIPWGTPSRLDLGRALEMLKAKGASDSEIASLYNTEQAYQVREVSEKKAVHAVSDDGAPALPEPEKKRGKKSAA